MMDIEGVIKKWSNKSVDIKNVATYKKMCHIDPSPWEEEARIIDMMLVDLGKIKNSNKKQ